MSQNFTEDEPNDPITAQYVELCIQKLANILSKAIEGDKTGFNPALIKEYLDSIIEFGKSFDEVMSDPNSNVSITDLEKILLRLIKQQDIIARNLAFDKILNFDDKSLILKKKVNIFKKI
ncbi:MAG: hypothetical protein LBW85_03135 [Deltaproteobacteria bacterium]|jgi:hypothetical protein|nr:hypothetical protein [Deltaproteobacteria bacterium]